MGHRGRRFKSPDLEGRVPAPLHLALQTPHLGGQVPGGRPERGCPHPDPRAALPEKPSFSPVPCTSALLALSLLSINISKFHAHHTSIYTYTHRHVHVYVCPRTFACRPSAPYSGQEARCYTPSLLQQLTCALNPPGRQGPRGPGSRALCGQSIKPGNGTEFT